MVVGTHPRSLPKAGSVTVMLECIMNTGMHSCTQYSECKNPLIVRYTQSFHCLSIIAGVFSDVTKVTSK